METITNILEFTLFSYKEFHVTGFGLISIVLIFLGARIALWGLGKALSRSFAKKSIVDPGRRHALQQIAKYIAYTLALILSLQSLGINLSLLMAGSAALLVGIGFGLQNTFNDFISGIIILFDRSIEVNDVVQVGDLVGRIQRIGIRATTIDTRDGISVIVPNAKFTQDNVINWSHNHSVTRFNVQVGVAYGSDVALVMREMQVAVEHHPEVVSQPKVRVRFIDFGDSALVFEVLFWTKDSFNVEFTKSDIRVAIDAAFRRAGIQIPFPQRDLHLISDRRGEIAS